MSRDINPFGLRMQPELRAKIEQAAKASGRSMNSEIVARLEESFMSYKLSPDDRESLNYLLDGILKEIREGRAIRTRATLQEVHRRSGDADNAAQDSVE